MEFLYEHVFLKDLSGCFYSHDPLEKNIIMPSYMLSVTQRSLFSNIITE